MAYERSSGRPWPHARVWVIGAARDSAVGAVRRHLGTSIDARADYCFDPGASTKAASTRCALVANGRCAATRGPRLAFTLPHGYHERGARGWLCPKPVARRLRRGCCSRARKHPGSWLAPSASGSAVERSRTSCSLSARCGAAGRKPRDARRRIKAGPEPDQGSGDCWSRTPV